MRTLTDIAFATLLARADVAQAALARRVGITPRQVNTGCRGRAAVPVWAAIVARVLQHRSPEA
jgi:DNA-binding transcriptional regulator YdaS (Cro superfamily)